MIKENQVSFRHYKFVEKFRDSVIDKKKPDNIVNLNP